MYNSDVSSGTYKVKKSMLQLSELNFLKLVESVLPHGYLIQPKVALSSIISCSDPNTPLTIIADACIMDFQYQPICIIKIKSIVETDNSQSEAEMLLKHICDEAGVPLLSFCPTSVSGKDYIEKRITDAINKSKSTLRAKYNSPVMSIDQKEKKKSGCYIATAVYGSYDCPPVWTLRRFRDYTLAENPLGRAFIAFYYAVSPTLVALFGKQKWFNRFWRFLLDRMISRLENRGVSNTPYNDRF